MTDPFDLPGLERAREERSEKDKLAAQLVAGDLKWLMEQKRGRRIVWRWLEEAGVYRSSFNTSGSVMAFNEGMRNFGLRILSQVMEAAPGTFATMLEENQK